MEGGKKIVFRSLSGVNRPAQLVKPNCWNFGWLGLGIQTPRGSPQCVCILLRTVYRSGCQRRQMGGGNPGSDREKTFFFLFYFLKNLFNPRRAMAFSLNPMARAAATTIFLPSSLKRYIPGCCCCCFIFFCPASCPESNVRQSWWLERVVMMVFLSFFLSLPNLLAVKFLDSYREKKTRRRKLKCIERAVV